MPTIVNGGQLLERLTSIEHDPNARDLVSLAVMLQELAGDLRKLQPIRAGLIGTENVTAQAVEIYSRLRGRLVSAVEDAELIQRRPFLRKEDLPPESLLPVYDRSGYCSGFGRPSL